MRFMKNSWLKNLLVVTLVVYAYLTSGGCSGQSSLDKRIAITQKYEVNYLAQDAKKNPENIVLNQVSNKLSSAFDIVQRTKHPLTNPYLVNVCLVHQMPYGKSETYNIFIDWFENRFVAHSIQFRNTETLETWTYNFQCDAENDFNKLMKGIRFIQDYRFGTQKKGGKLVSIEDGIKLTELAKSGRLTAVLVNDEDEVLSNQVKVDSIVLVHPACF